MFKWSLHVRCVIFYEGNEHFDLCMTSFYALATFCGLLAIATFKGLALYKEKQQIRSLCTNLFASPNCSEDYFLLYRHSKRPDFYKI